MARLQILELPEGTGDDRPPFVLVVDQVDDELAEDITRWPDDIAKRIGARQVLCFPGTIDIPANDTTAYLSGGSRLEYAVKVGDQDISSAIEADMPKVRDKDQELRAANEWIERLNTEAEEARAILRGRKRQLNEALGINPLNGWDRIIEAAATLRQDRDEQAAAITRVRSLHRPVEHNGQTICWECSAYDFERLTTDNPPVAHDQCGTHRALSGEQAHAQEQA